MDRLLFAGSQACVQAMDLNDADSKIVSIIIQKYSEPDSFCETLSTLVYRLIQAVKRLFCCESDWQKASRIIENQALQKAKDLKIIQDSPVGQVDQVFRARFIDSINKVAHQLLLIAVDAQDCKAEDSEAFNLRLSKLKLSVALSHFSRIYEAMNTVWFTNNFELKKPFAFNDPTKNVVILGKIHSEEDVWFKTKSMVVFGELKTTKKVFVEADGDFFNDGRIEGGSVDIIGHSVANGLAKPHFEKIKALGIDIFPTNPGQYTVKRMDDFAL
jgi:hypothetical protein